MKKILAIFLAVLMLTAFTGCQKNTPKDEDSISCTFTVNASLAAKNEALDKDVASLLKEDGMLANAKSFTVKKGTTAGDAFKAFCKENNIVLNSEVSEYGLFVKGIGGLDNGACGSMSCWLFKVNGEFSDVGADSVTVNEGDTFEWIFTCDGGPDVGYNWEE